jgi:hypothetical protein
MHTGAKELNMPRKKKTWAEKLAEAKAKKDLPKKFRCDKSGMHLYVPSVTEIEQEMRRVRKGKVRTIKEITQKLTERHGVDMACPMTTGIFAWIIAHAADEQEQAGAKRIVPWWRTVKTGGELNPKYPGGVNAQRAQLQAEGHRVIRKGKRHLVEAAMGK